jgi:hypothetical protein
MKTMLAIVGAFTLFLGLLGSFGIGNFVMIYSSDKINCIKESNE